MKYFILFFMTIFLSFSGFAQKQKSYSDNDYMRKPLWIGMMEDENANFFEVEKAFNLYFSKHEKPEGEHEEIGEHAERLKHVSQRKLRKVYAENDLRFAVKKYELWHYQSLPYVQEDGRILNAEERLKIWESQKSQ